jgi:hypothetical protein
MKRRRRVYIAGPMTGIPEHNHPAFKAAWNALTQAGYEAISPHFIESVIEIDSRVQIGQGAVYRYALPIDTFALSSCEAVVALPGWEQSQGCGFEKHAADLMDIPWVAPEWSDRWCETENQIMNLDLYLNDCITLLKQELLCQESS